jgi:hypothetical protein
MRHDVATEKKRQKRQKTEKRREFKKCQSRRWNTEGCYYLYPSVDCSLCREIREGREIKMKISVEKTERQEIRHPFLAKQPHTHTHTRLRKLRALLCVRFSIIIHVRKDTNRGNETLSHKRKNPRQTKKGRTERTDRTDERTDGNHKEAQVTDTQLHTTNTHRIRHDWSHARNTSHVTS